MFCHFVRFVSFAVSLLVLSSTVFSAEKKDQKTSLNDRSLSSVEEMIFERPHLSNINDGQGLIYQFQREGQLGDNFKDKVTLYISKSEQADEGTVSFDFFTGERRRPYPDLTEVRTNPLLVLYFNKDAWDLSRRIKAKGTVNYLRNRILESLSKVKEVKETTCSYQGKSLPGQQIEIRPFLNDENKHHLLHYYAITYSITLSDEIPGGLCEIRSVVPFPSEPVPEHFLTRLKQLGMTSLASEAEKVDKNSQKDRPVVVERLLFDQLVDGKGGDDRPQ